jgi:transposase
MREQKNYETIKSLIDHNGNKNRAVTELGVTRRTIDRMIAGYKREGKSFFSHGNKGRTPATALPEETRERIVNMYDTKYYDCTYEFFTELLAKKEKIHISISTARNILMEAYTLSPRSWRRTVKAMRNELESKKTEAVSGREKKQIELKLIDIEDAHPRRPRKANFGEELQMDASVYAWFGGVNSHLHAAIDDATGIITGAYFDWQETLSGYYHVYANTLRTYGIPYKFRTDRRTVFEYKKTGSNRADEDTFTQFAYACKQLGTHIETTSIPQGKGRVERLFQTLQGRLPILLRLAGITTIEDANEFLTSYINEFNAQFALDYNAIPSVFEKQPSNETINLTLAVLCERSVDAGHSIKFMYKYYQTVGADGVRVCLAPRTKGLFIRAFDGRMFFSAQDAVFSLTEVAERQSVSKDFSPAKEQKKNSPPYVPPQTHPWKMSTFGKFRAKLHSQGDMPPAA